MYHLVIAKDKECKKYIPIKSGDYNFISKYTTRFEDSKEIIEEMKCEEELGDLDKNKAKSCLIF